MKRFFIGTILALVIGLTTTSPIWAEFGVSNFRMSDQPGGSKMTQFPKDIKTVYVMFDYKDANNMPIQIRAYDPRGQVIYQETKNYNGNGSETLKVQLAEGVPLSEGDYVTNVFTNNELYLRESLEWTVGQPSSRPPAAVTSIAIQVPNSQQSSQATPATSDGGLSLPIMGAGVLGIALIGLVAWAVRGFIIASR
jgi:hypothetical protein